MKSKALSAKGNCYFRAKKFIDKVKEKHTKEITLDGDFQKEEKVADELKRIDQKHNLIKKSHECYLKAVDLEIEGNQKKGEEYYPRRRPQGCFP